ncbi:hypothetical protein PMI17_04710 [Pantoea sp. GM01]|nr:hypothetical protein PMI17_04710 [Pantoea sp. GM01]
MPFQRCVAVVLLLTAKFAMGVESHQKTEFKFSN